MKIEVEINEKEILESVHHGIKKAIANRITEGSYQKGAFRSELDNVIDKLLPSFVEKAFEDLDIAKIINDKAEKKANSIVQKMVNQVRIA